MNLSHRFEAVDSLRVKQQRGFTLAELVVSTAVLVGVMTFVTTLSFRINQVWKDINQQRIATGELSNQLDELALLSGQELTDAMNSLQPSRSCVGILESPEINGTLAEDELGSRLDLELKWRPGNPRRVRLSGWAIQPQNEDAGPDSYEQEQSTQREEDQ